MKNQTFGVELEMVIDRAKAAQVIGRYFNTNPYYEGGGYCKYVITDNQERTWIVMRDSSIQTESDYQKCELVTPICKWEDIETVQEIVRQLRKAGAKVNDSCGCHVHVGAKEHTGQTLKNLINIFYSKDTILYKALDVRKNGVSHFAKTFKDELINRINVVKKPSVKDILDIWYSVNSSFHSRTTHYHHSRYHGLNLHSYESIGTVEFRLFNSTLHAGELKSYIQLALAINHQALTQRSASKAKTTDIIEHCNYKYTFRTWLLRLQLKGPEFETARLHLLKKLPGNTAGNSVLRQRAAV